MLREYEVRHDSTLKQSGKVGLLFPESEGAQGYQSQSEFNSATEARMTAVESLYQDLSKVLEEIRGSKKSSGRVGQVRSDRRDRSPRRENRDRGPPRNNDNRFRDVQCNTCGRFGHIARYCEDRRQQNWKGAKEIGNLLRDNRNREERREYGNGNRGRRDARGRDETRNPEPRRERWESGQRTFYNSSRRSSMDNVAGLPPPPRNNFADRPRRDNQGSAFDNASSTRYPDNRPQGN